MGSAGTPSRVLWDYSESLFEPGPYYIENNFRGNFLFQIFILFWLNIFLIYPTFYIKSKNYAYFPEVNTSDIRYDVQIVAFSEGGYTESALTDFSLKASPDQNFGKIC